MKLFSNPRTLWKANHFWKHNEQVSKSPWITMDRKGANTFPFYKSTARTERHLEKEFCCAFVLSMLENIKDGGDSCLPRYFAEKNAKCKPVLNNQFCHRITLRPYRYTPHSFHNVFLFTYECFQKSGWRIQNPNKRTKYKANKTNKISMQGWSKP